MVRKFNFNPGPGVLPFSVLQKVQAEFTDYRGVGMSIVEMSHRSKEFEAILAHVKQNFKDILGIPEGYEIIFVGGGASLQFAMIPMNFLGKDQVADYVNTGEWARRAIKEAKLFGKVHVAGDTESDNYTHLPSELVFSSNAQYLHLTSNNTIFGTQWPSYPETGNVPLIVDMSSDFMSRKVDVKKYAMIYAGAQKNIGPAGVTAVIIRKDMLDKVVNREIPTMMQYKTHVENNSLYNTPPVFSIYMVDLVTEWIKEMGGLQKIEEMNDKKAKMIYDIMDSMPDFYKGTVTQKEHRSKMNITFRLPSEDLEKKFEKEATAKNLFGLKGHRSVGGMRASVYNAFPIEGVEELCKFMKEFAANNRK
ncbi:MAG: 3-phosphoserine/phosphohydroxythreonine transaminase [Candidatus Brocadiae bacterium]|nr:3-phosphoserine/phosphohydroxythreonine transaminase [Candidatus Brocadiia bacterium]